jgi:hypothetical protein
MIVSGIFLKSNLVRICTLKGTKNEHTVIAEKFNKLEIPKNPSKENVEAFVLALKTFCTEYSIDLVVINRRSTTGKWAGGAGTFLNEGVLLATSPVPIIFIAQTTIAATERKQAELKGYRPGTVDLGKAYDLAFECLE